jgi:hypothetical protein
VNIRFYDRGLDAKSVTVRDHGTLRDIDHLSMQLLDDVRAERARDPQDRFRVWHGREQRDDDRSHRRRPYPPKSARSTFSKRTEFLVGTGQVTSPAISRD